MENMDQNTLVCARTYCSPCHAMPVIRFRTAGILPPFIPLVDIAQYIPPVIFDQFYCGACFSQHKIAVHRLRKRFVTYYMHCHCSSPNSLQCLCAAKVVKDVFFKKNHSLKNCRVLKITNVCCNYWACVPVKFLGMYVNGQSDTHYFIVLPSSFTDDLIDMASRYAVTTVKFRDDLIFAMISCRCSGNPECLKAFSRMLNCFRMITCCSFNA